MADPKLNIEITAKLDSLDRDFARVNGMARDTASKVERAFGGLGSSLKGIAGGLVAAFSVDMFAGIFTGAVEAQDHLNDLSKSTSISVETLAGLGAAARKSGGNLDDVAASVNKLSVNMGKDPEKFKAIGISAKEPIEAFKQLADVFVSIQDPQERAAFGAAALGKSWAGTAPLLAEGGKSIGEMVERGTRLSKVTADSAKAADELNDRLEDLQTASQGTKTAFVNLVIPAMIETLRIMDQMRESGSILAPLLSGIGRQRFSFDPNFASSETQFKDLKAKLSGLETDRANLVASGGGLINIWLYGNKDDLDQKILITRNQVDALSKMGDKLVKPAETQVGRSALSAADVRKFLDGDKSTPKVTTQISDGQRLIQQLRDRMSTQEQLTEVEKLQLSFADSRYKIISFGEKDIALSLAAQIDARGAINKELDAELVMVKELTKTYDAQEARLQSLIASTDHGKNAQTMQDEALAESALFSGKIDSSTYDQIIEKLREVKDEGKDTFKELQDAIDGWGKQGASAIADFAVDGSASFSGMTKSIIKDMVAMVAQQNITGPLAKSIGSFDWKGLFGGSAGTTGTTNSFMTNGVALGSAKGNVFTSPGLSAFSGQVVSSPTVFPFARGIGLMGEAGPEAIMPLSRGSDGKLGVRAGGGTPNVSIVVNNTVSDKVQATVQPRMNNGKLEFEVLIQQAVAKDLRSNGPMAQGLSSTFGLARAI